MQKEQAIRQLIDRVGRRYVGERFVVASLIAIIAWMGLFTFFAILDWSKPLPSAVRIGILVFTILAIAAVWVLAYGSFKRRDNQKLAVTLIERRIPALNNQLSASVDLLGGSNTTNVPEYLRKRLLDRVANALSSIDASMIVSYARVRRLTVILAAAFSFIVVVGLVAPGFVAKSIDRLYRLERDPVALTNNAPTGAVQRPAALPVGIQ